MDIIRVAVDAMGGDHAPEAPVRGAIEAVTENEQLRIILLGDEPAIRSIIGTLHYPEDRVTVQHCTERIEMAEPPVAAIQKKKDSSIVRGMMMLRRGEADAFVSAGSTGAVLVGGQVLVGRIRGVERPPLGALMPTEKGMSLLIDCGANVDARPAWLLQFAEMGSIYVEHALGIPHPTVGILNIGAEEEKGNALVKETIPLLKECGSINFIGSVEARDIPAGAADVIVTDAFSGNIVMKMYEGTATTIYRIAKNGLKKSVPGVTPAEIWRSAASRSERTGRQGARKLPGYRIPDRRESVRDFLQGEHQRSDQRTDGGREREDPRAEAEWKLRSSSESPPEFSAWKRNRSAARRIWSATSARTILTFSRSR